MSEDGRGRPTIKTPETVNKIIAAFHNGYNDGEACAYSGISRETFYAWLREDQDFSDKVGDAKTMPNRKAKEVLIDSINAGSDSNAKWWLERRDPEFKTKTEVDNRNPDLDEKRDELREWLDGIKRERDNELAELSQGVS